MASPLWSLQELLRFLSTDAKIPLAVAMRYAKNLSKAKLTNAKSIVDLEKGALDELISDPHHRKAVLNAARRIVKEPGKKRKAGDEGKVPSKFRRVAPRKPQHDFDKLVTDAETDIKKLEKITISINRAPFMLVFAMVHTVLVHNVSVASALSLAHSYITANAISKGRSIGIIPEKSEDEISLKEMLGGSTQPVIKVMGRDIALVRQPEEGEYRAIDVSTLKKRHLKHEAEGSDLYNIPTYSPEGAYGYLKRAFGNDLPAVIGACLVTMQSWIKGEGTEEEKEASKAELEKQGYGMYVQCRPDVPYGEAGWGKKAELRLAKILDLRKKSDEEKAEDNRNRMTDEDGRQLSIEESMQVKSDESTTKEEKEKAGNKRSTSAPKTRPRKKD